MKNKNHLKEFEKTLGIYDKEFYYHILLLPTRSHKSLILLRSLNLDLALIFAKSSTPQAGMIRLEWWKNLLEETDSPWRGQCSDHSLQDMILSEIHNGNLDRDSLLHMVNARRSEFNGDNFSNTSEFYEYVEFISSPYFHHVFQALEIPITAQTQEIIKLAGRSWGITSIMRGMAFFKEQNRSVFSQEQLKKFHMDNATSIHKDNFKDNNKILMQSLVTEVKSYLDRIQDIISTYEYKPPTHEDQSPTYECNISTYEDHKKTKRKHHKRKLKKAVLPLIFVKTYLKEITALDFNVYAIDHHKKHLGTLLKLWLMR